MQRIQRGAVTQIEAGLDWLSATCAAEQTVCSRVYDAAMSFLEHQQSEGNTLKAATLLGYKGVICGKCFIGDGETGIFARSTSGVSTTFYEHIYTPEMHVSRIDLQVTVWVSGNNYHIGREARQDAAYFRTTHPREAKRKITAIDDEDGGYTLYIGSKSSEHFCRLYDKGAESRNDYYAGAWRYEVEFHNDSATEIALYLFQNGLQLEKVISSTVRQYFEQRGVPCPWYAADELSALRPKERMETDHARTLKWLAAQVRPSIKRLEAAGLLPSAMEALGLLVD